MTDRLVLQVQSRLSEVARIAPSLREFADRHAVPTRAILAVNLALEEIMVNTISYGYADLRDRSIRVELTVTDGWLVVRVEDDAGPFDPTTRPAPDLSQRLEDRPVGGLGIHLVRGLFDAVEYERAGGRNVLVLRKGL
jgi:anti-sigma regulatory factor (Ser/Thr protein kinase)